MKTLLALIAILVIISVVLTIRTQASANQKIFLAGTIPSPMPDGVYKGTAEITASWRGKKFTAAAQSGINEFANADGTTHEEYPFKTYTAKGLRDTDTDVLKIDYDIPGNPLWLRPVLDEIVQIPDGSYLGKVHYRFPYFPITIGYFQLMK